jgi:ribosome-binding factor A
MGTRRQKRVAELIHRELSYILEGKMGDPRVQGVTVVDVDVTPDLRIARVRIAGTGTDEERREALRGLRGAAGFLRRELAADLALRYAPELTFSLDNTWEEASRIDALLEEIHRGSSGEHGHEDDRQD